MLRLLLQYILPLLLPLMAYLAFTALVRRRGWRLDDTPWAILLAAGVGLLAISLITWSFLTGAPPGQVYVPPRFEDGRVLPATTVDPDAVPADPAEAKP